MQGKNILVTGGAGFVASHLVSELLRRNHRVFLLDNINAAYDPHVKRKNLKKHLSNPLCSFLKGDVRDPDKLSSIFSRNKFDSIIHLAALTRVRESLLKPDLYMEVNVEGTRELINWAIKNNCPQFIFASSSVVYGLRDLEPFSEADAIGKPLSPYAESKIAGELLCNEANLSHNLDTICLRFFNVYGPRQNPNTALQKFMRLLQADQTLEVYGYGNTWRDYVYVRDVVSAIISCIEMNLSGHKILNIGSSQPIRLLDTIRQLELAVGKKAKITYKEPVQGEALYAYADISSAKQLINYEPLVSFAAGVAEMVNWYKSLQRTADKQNLYTMKDRLHCYLK